MSLTILYRHPQHPDEAGRTRVSHDGDGAAMRGQLERRGFQIVKVVHEPAKATQAIDHQNRQP